MLGRHVNDERAVLVEFALYPLWHGPCKGIHHIFYPLVDAAQVQFGVAAVCHERLEQCDGMGIDLRYFFGDDRFVFRFCF